MKYNYGLATTELTNLSQNIHIDPIYLHKNGEYLGVLKQHCNIKMVIFYSNKSCKPIEISKSNIVLNFNHLKSKVKMSWTIINRSY